MQNEAFDKRILTLQIGQVKQIRNLCKFGNSRLNRGKVFNWRNEEQKLVLYISEFRTDFKAEIKRRSVMLGWIF